MPFNYLYSWEIYVTINKIIHQSFKSYSLLTIQHITSSKGPSHTIKSTTKQGLIRSTSDTWNTQDLLGLSIWHKYTHLPISLLSPLAKTLDKTLLTYITNIPHITAQDCYKRNHSTDTALRNIYNAIATPKATTSTHNHLTWARHLTL